MLWKTHGERSDVESLKSVEFAFGSSLWNDEDIPIAANCATSAEQALVVDAELVIAIHRSPK